MKKRMLSLFLALVMAVGLVPMSALATGDHAVTVGFTVVDCLDGEIEYMRKELTVTPGLAKEYLDGEYGGSIGSAVEVGPNDVTPIDVLVAAHIDKYGDAFTNDPAKYISGFDYVIKMFEEDSEITWTANGIMPAENGVGYAVNQYKVKESDEICFYRMSFSSYPSSVYASFDMPEVEVSVGEELTLQLGFCALMDYTSTPYPAAGAALHYLKEDGSVGDQTEWTTDENGQVKVSFDAAGTYYLTCSGTVSYYDAMWGMDNQGTLSPAYCKVTVTAGTEEPPVEPEPEPTAYTVTLPSGDGYSVTAREGSSSPVTEGGSYSFSVTLAEGYQTGEDFTVKANDAVLTAVDGVYTIENITADQTISVGGVVKQETEEVPTPDWQEVMAKTQAYLTAQANNEAPGVGSAYGEWMVLGLARAGLPISTAFFQTYYNTVVQYVKDHIDESGRLDDGKSTENSRLILSLTALGKDVTLVGGHDLLQGLSDTEHVTKQGINGPIWALIALDSHDYTIPVDAEITRDWLVEDILSKELPGGGWGMSQIPDDMTGMAVQALAPYYNNREDVKAAVDRAIPVMENMIPHVSVENLAQMVVALSALGVDSGTETLEAALTQLLTFAEEDGSFRFGSGSNQMATEQAFYALVAYDRFRSGKTALYDMSDVTIEESTPDTPDNPGTPSQPNPPAETPEFGLSKDEIDGYVTVSFEDKGVRVAGDEGTYPKALGTILKKTRVPYTQGDTIADVTLRALDAYDFTYSHTGTTKSGFYLSSIGSFTVNGIDYDSFGEFDAGTGSGWMITWDGEFINKGASEFQVENGDVIRWQYTCQLGADIGDDGSAVGGGNQAPQVHPEVLPEVPPVTSSPYTDVTGHWAEKAITFVYEKGLMTGTKEDTFSPETQLSRAMLVTILYRMAGEPAVTADNTFSDVMDGTWYTNAVIWASRNGIVNGVGQDRFAPNSDITREQMAAMLLRYSDYKDYDTAQRNDLSGYADADSISAWALEALRWANGEGLITGRTADQLVPQGDTTRAETATILMRYLETIA